MGRVKTRLGVHPSRRDAWDYDFWFKRVTGIVTDEASRRLTVVPLVACNGCSDKIAPFCPAAVVVADFLVAE